MGKGEDEDSVRREIELAQAGQRRIAEVGEYLDRQRGNHCRLTKHEEQRSLPSLPKCRPGNEEDATGGERKGIGEGVRND